MLVPWPKVKFSYHQGTCHLLDINHAGLEDSRDINGSELGHALLAHSVRNDALTFAGMVCPNLAKTRALCGFHVMNFIITELRGLVMCQ